MSRQSIVWWAVTAGLVCAPVAIATPVMTEDAILSPSDGPQGGGSGFGQAVAIEGDYAVVGARNDDEIDELTGAAYIYHRVGDTWVEQVKITASDGFFNDAFGMSVAINGNRIVVGAHNSDPFGSFVGKAYVFERNGGVWTETQRLVSSGSVRGDRFGMSVAIDGERIVVGAPTFSGGELESAYVFRWTGVSWVEEAELIASDAQPADFFGSAVGIYGTTVVVGSPWDDHSGENSAGSAYVFGRVGAQWVERAKLTASDTGSGTRFGRAVAVSGDYAIVGARYSGATISSGAAYVFRRVGNVWSEVAKLIASDGAPQDDFGVSVGIDGGGIVVGARDADSAAPDAGAVYLYTLAPEGWSENHRLIASDADQVGGSLGRSVSIDNGLVLAGFTFSTVRVYDVAHLVPDVPEAPDIPTVSAWGMVVFILLVLVVGTCAFRRSAAAP